MMQRNCKFIAFLLVLVGVFVFSGQETAQAQPATSAQSVTSGYATPDPTSSTDTCGKMADSTGATPLDTNYQRAHAIAGQVVSKNITNAWTNLQKIDIAAMYCAVKLITIFQLFVDSINGLTDPLNIIMAIVTGQILALLNNVCSQVLGAISTLTNSLSALARICIPLPNFNLNLNLGIKVPQCSGGTSIPLIATGSMPAAIPFKPNGWLPVNTDPGMSF